MTKHDSEGFNKSAGGMSEIDAFLSSNKMDPSLRSAVIHSTPMTQTKRQILACVGKNPMLKGAEYAEKLDKVSVLVDLSNFVDIGYVVKHGRILNKSKFSLSERGQAALDREIDSTARIGVINSLMSSYEPYIPERTVINRPGQDDASRLKSKGTA